jgi:hypothetical protein
VGAIGSDLHAREELNIGTQKGAGEIVGLPRTPPEDEKPVAATSPILAAAGPGLIGERDGAFFRHKVHDVPQSVNHTGRVALQVAAQGVGSLKGFEIRRHPPLGPVQSRREEERLAGRIRSVGEAFGSGSSRLEKGPRFSGDHP